MKYCSVVFTAELRSYVVNIHLDGIVKPALLYQLSMRVSVRVLCLTSPPTCGLSVIEGLHPDCWSISEVEWTGGVTWHVVHFTPYVRDPNLSIASTPLGGADGPLNRIDVLSDPGELPDITEGGDESEPADEHVPVLSLSGVDRRRQCVGRGRRVECAGDI